MSNSKKKQKKRTTKAVVRRLLSSSCVAVVRRRCAAGRGCGCHVCRCHSSLLVAVVCCVLCVLCSGRSPYCVLHFCNMFSGRVGSGQPNTYRSKNKKKELLQPLLHFRHGVAIRNPQRHRYLVAFFQISATLLRHGAAMAAI